MLDLNKCRQCCLDFAAESGIGSFTEVSVNHSTRVPWSFFTFDDRGRLLSTIVFRCKCVESNDISDFLASAVNRDIAKETSDAVMGTLMRELDKEIFGKMLGEQVERVYENERPKVYGTISSTDAVPATCEFLMHHLLKENGNA